MSSYESIDQQMLSLSVNYNDYNRARAIPSSYKHKSPISEDHPEPQLLATSVGQDLDGRLIPSTSTISLLSLNQERKLDGERPDSININKYDNLLKNYNDSFKNHDKENSNAFILERKNSTSGYTVNHYMNQQRIQHYHQKNYSDNNLPPDSPNLDPVSLHGSPSRFWLNSQTPPRSLSSSNLSRNHLNQLFSMGKIKLVGSPNLRPVQTQDPPMTPLYLNETKDGYFSYIPIEENEDSEEESLDQLKPEYKFET